MKSNKRGFSLAEILLSIVVIGIITALGWVVIQQKFQDNTKSYVQLKQAESERENTAVETKNTYGYLELLDFGVKIPLSKDTQNLKLGRVTGSIYSESDKDVTLLAPELQAAWTCADGPNDSDKPSIGSISVTTDDKRAGAYEPLLTKKLGRYTFGYENNQPDTSNCTVSPEYKALVDAFKTQFEEMVTI